MAHADPHERFDAATVRAVLALVDYGPARLGGGAPEGDSLRRRLLCIDGPAGSGKSTLAEQVAEQRGAHVVHLDDLLAGWEGGLPRVVSDLVADVLAPLSGGRPAAYRRFDWHADRFAGRVPVPAGELLVVEGVGAGSRATAPYRSALVWVDAPRALRMERGIARDGEAFAPHWDAWARREVDHFAREASERRADLRLRSG